MNPFENENNIDQIVTNNLNSTFNITVWKENKKRKINTYVSGWNIDETELKQYLKDFKVKNGCNGSLKSENGNFILHLQGDKIDKITSYLLEKGIKSEEITKQGL